MMGCWSGILGGSQVMLPTDYVADAVELGYASTLHRAQGATVDRALVLVDESMSREGLYVGLTRGRASNEAFVVTDGRSAAEVLRLVAGRSGAAVSARGMIEQAEREVGSPAHACGSCGTCRAARMGIVSSGSCGM